VVVTFSGLSLQRRATAALNVIDAYPGLSIAERHELVYLALCPPALELPGAVKRDELTTPNVDLRRTPRPPKPRPRVAPPPTVTSGPVTPEIRDEARRLFRSGTTMSELAEAYDQPWPVIRAWVRGRA
jgi:hypothetical protein